MTERKIEILAPAGSYAAFTAAVRAGADAVYVGGSRFGARAFADNFTEEELICAIKEAHLYGRKIYLTVNTLLKDTEISTLYDYLAPFYEAGLDAVIVQDLGVVYLIRKLFPGLDIHASTQMTITGPDGAKFVQEQGMTRVVPARELSLAEIRAIRENTDLEIECFVHGALCYCYSGQCLMSSMIGGRSGNRGQCAQPCRLPYFFKDKKHYFLSPKDICTLDLIPDMTDAGIDSFKIEGRMKKPEYVAAVTSAYRKYADLYLKKGRKAFHIEDSDREMLMDIYNRGGFSEGYYRRHNGKSMITLDRPNHTGVAAVKIENQKGRKVTARAVTGLNPGDVIEITGGKDNYTLGTSVEKGKTISFLVRKGIRLNTGHMLNRIRNTSLINCINRDIIDRNIQLPLNGYVTLTEGSPATLTISIADGREAAVTASTVEPVSRAQNRPMDSGRIRAQISKTGGSDFYFQELTVTCGPDIFIPVQQLNQLRRDAFSLMKARLSSENCRVLPANTISEESFGNNGSVVRKKQPVFSISVSTAGQLYRLAGYMKKTDFLIFRIYVESSLAIQAVSESDVKFTGILNRLKESGTELILALPHIFRKFDPDSKSQAEKLLKIGSDKEWDGILVRNCEEFEIFREHAFDKKIILDHNLYIFNHFTKQFWTECGVTGFTAPLELNEKELEMLDLDGFELLIYGYFPVMLSAQCVLKTTGQCRRAPESSTITDRRGSRFPIRNHCGFCYNVIYSDHPLFLNPGNRKVRNLNPSSMRIQFTLETPDEVEERLHMIHSLMNSEGSRPEEPDFEYTFGHFKRGVM